MSSSLNTLSLSPADAARILSRTSGGPVTENDLVDATAAGLPTDARGHFNLFHLAAWLNQELRGGTS